MKKITYSTKDVCDIFNIGRETLRHYERLGLISPTINPENGYREYSYWDVGTIIDILKYRAVGLSLPEIGDTLFNSDYSEILDRLENMESYYSKMITHYKMLQRKTLRDIQYGRLAEDYLDELLEISIEDLFFVPYTLDRNDSTFEPMQKAFRHSQYFTTAIEIDVDKIGKPDEMLTGYGLVTEKKYAEYLGINKGKDIPASRVISQMIDIQGKDRITREHFAGFVNAIKDKYPNFSTPIYAFLMSRFYDKEKRYHQYFFVFAKI